MDKDGKERASGTPPRMADVARLAGVSKMTVSRVLAGRPVAPETRERVLSVVAQTGYVADAAAGALSSGRTSFVAVLVPSLSSSNFSDTVHGINDTIGPRGLQMLLANTDYEPEREEEQIRDLLRYQPRAIVLTGGHHTDEVRVLLERARVPVVETWEMPARPIDRVVGFSNAEASAAMVEHLHARGYRRVGFIGIASRLDRRGLDRERGYLKAVDAAGFGAPRLVELDQPTNDMAHGTAMAYAADALGKLMARWPDTDAVMCASDIHAFGALMAAQRRGLRVPRDLAVAGFGDFEIASHCYPTITTVSVDPRGIGRLAGEAVLAALDQAEGSEAQPAPKVVRVEFKVVPREST